MMMNSHDELFHPESVEEQIEQLRQIASQSAENTMPNRRMIQDLRAASTDYTRSGERVWSRLAKHMAQQNETAKVVGLGTREKLPHERMHPMHSPYMPDHSQKRKRLSLFAATLVAALLVSLLALVLTQGRNHQNTPVAVVKTATPAATPTSLPAGSIVHVQSSDKGTNLSPSVAWSPDSQRLAALAFNQQDQQDQLQIWDATTGDHRLTVPLNASFSNVLWSPEGKYLAVSSLQSIVIVDSQTGSVVNTISQLASVASPTLTGRSPLSTLIDYGSGAGFYSVAWTPDGSSLAVNVSNYTTGKVELINPLTSAIKTTFSERASSVGIALAFSSDGQYLASSYPNDWRVVVWKVSTQAVVFEQDDIQTETIAWQPGTHHLARAVSYPVSVQLWDVTSQKLIKTYPGISSFVWSPDGEKLATYRSPLDQMRLRFSDSKPLKDVSKVVIIDATSGSQIAAYTSKYPVVEIVAWSPDGRYLASGEGSTTTSQIVVWAA